MLNLNEKICRTCDNPKEKKEFRRLSRGKETTQPDCKSCRADKEHARGLRRNYGITVGEYNEMLAIQSDCCDCCGNHKSLFKRRLHVDHDKETGMIRGLLCTECNPGIGYFKHSIHRMEQGIAYLTKFKK